MSITDFDFARSIKDGLSNDKYFLLSAVEVIEEA